jgi:formylglycine-generating enzyme required for sulfatase activity
VDEAAGPGPPPDKCPASLVRKKERFCRDVVASGQPGPLLVVVPPGKFRMGSDLGAEESPPHDVSLARPIAIGVHEVSVDEYRTFCESAGHSCPESQGSAGDLPMVMISWRDAVAYADWLSAQTGHEYRLPSESEWEYAARGGTQTRFPFGDEMTSADAAFSGLRPRKAPAPRSERFNRNAFSLYHAVGNVREWVQDDWSPTYAGAPVDGSPRRGSTSEKVVRGGSFADGFDGVRSSSRRPLGGATKDPYTGFRVVREIR